MKEKNTNLFLVIILIILIIIALVTAVINKEKLTQKVDVEEKAQIVENVNYQDQEEVKKINEQEEKQRSMQSGNVFCKIGEQIVFYQDSNKSIYKYNETEGICKKIATLKNSVNKIYFDGENIYYIPNYYSGKGIYKIDLEGNIKTIYEGASLQLWITDNEIYFVKQIGYDDVNQNPQGSLCVMDKEGKGVKELAKSVKNYFFIRNEKIYYTSQDRKMYEINIDGTNQKNIVNGRKFIIGMLDKFAIYIDYADQESEHLLNLETQEDTIIGHFGQLLQAQGKVYLNARKRTDDGSIEEQFTLFEIEENGNIKEIGQIADFGTNLNYITNGKAYTSKEGTMKTISLDNKEEQNAETYNSCRYFLGGYGYKINDTNLEEITIEKIQL